MVASSNPKPPLKTISKIPLQHLAADEGKPKKMERAMHRRQTVVANLEPTGLPHPGQASLHDLADLAQATAVRRPGTRQVIREAPLLQSLPGPRGAIGPVPV